MVCGGVWWSSVCSVRDVVLKCLWCGVWLGGCAVCWWCSLLSLRSEEPEMCLASIMVVTGNFLLGKRSPAAWSHNPRERVSKFTMLTRGILQLSSDQSHPLSNRPSLCCGVTL